MKVLITGGSGFIGSHLVEKMISEGFDVRILDQQKKLDNIKNLLPNPRIEFVEGDIRNYDACKKAVNGCDFVSHLAALISVDHSIQEPRPFWDVNVGGTFNLIDASLNAKIKRFQYMSSCEMLGHIEYPNKATENWPTYIPRSPYAASKLAAETYCNSYHITYDFPVVITRAFNVFGPKQNPGSRGAVIAKFITTILQNQVPTIYGDGEQSRDWTFVKDIVDGIFKAINSDRTEGETIHLCSGIDRKVKDIAEKVIEICGKNGKIKPVFIKERSGELRRSCGDYTKAKKLINWEPKVKFEDGLKLTLEYFKS